MSDCALLSLYSTTQQPPPSPFSKVSRAARVAASKTSSTPSPLKLEHSRYRFAPISRAIDSPSCSDTNRIDFLRISSIATGSSRRSFFRPTRMIGTPVQSRWASSIHYDNRSVLNHLDVVARWGSYLVLNVVERIWGVDRKAYQNDMGFRICKGS